MGKSVLYKYSNLLNHKLNTIASSSPSINDLLLSISHVSPETSRKFLRYSCLKPEHVLEILLGFQLGGGNFPFDAKIVDSLWEIFKRVVYKNEGFKHLPRSCEVMASMLIGAGMLREVELLLSSMENQGISLASDEILSGIIEGYVNAGELEKALLIYDKMNGHHLVPSLSCYRALLDHSMEKRKAIVAIRIYEDLVEVGFEFGDVEARNLEILIKFLCQDRKIKEARKLIKKIVGTGWQPSTAVLSEVADVYCEKKDFEDLLSFFVDMRSLPDILVCNKIIFSLCGHFGVDRAHSFLWELENLGFKPNEITFGIFISWSCLDGKLRDSFVYLSEILHRGLRPDRHSYNAVISGLFKAGIEEHARDVFGEMIDNGVEPDLATFRALLAGYSKARWFNEVKHMISEMVNRGLISMSPLEDPISKAFAILGLSPSTVKVKRDNDIKNFRTEFVDELGNGLYLDTNLEEFENAVTGVLEESLIPDFNLLVMRQCDLKNVEGALLLVDEMVQWGQTLSIPVLNVLVRLLCKSKSHIKGIHGLLDKLPGLFSQLDHKTLNLLLQSLSKKGFTEKCRLLVDEMHRRHLPITNATYNALLVGFCITGRLSDVLHCWDLSRKGNWLPEWKHFLTILDWLCQKRMVKELLELFDIMLASYPNLRMQVCDMFSEKLCSAGFTSLMHILVNELKQHYFELDHAIYSHLIKGYCLEKRFSEALMVFVTMQGDNFSLSSDALLLLVPKLCKANRTENVTALKDTYLRDHPSSLLPLYTALIDGFCGAGKITKADFFFSELILKNVVPTDGIYNTLLQSHCQNSDMKRVKELLCIMIRRSINFSVSSYRELIRVMCRKEMFHSALGLKRVMLVDDVKFSCSIMYNILIFYLFIRGNCSLVDSLLDELQETGLQHDQVGYNFLIYGFSICKDMSRSMKYLNDMVSKGLKPSNRSLRSVMRYLCSNGQVENALQLSNLIDSRGWIQCSTVQHILLESLLSHGEIHHAERFLAQIMEKCLIPDIINYENLIKKFCHCGRIVTAVNLLDQMLMKRSIPDSTTYDCIVQSFCSHNNLNRAMDFYNEMLERKLNPSICTWDALIEKLCVNGWTTESESVLITMVKVGETPTRKMYSCMIDRYRFENNLSKASELLKTMQKHGYEPDFTIQWSLISSLSHLSDRGSSDTRGFLSKLLLDSGFTSESGAKSKLR